MFRNRSIEVKLNKQPKNDAEERQDDRPIEVKTGAILSKLDKTGIKIFAGVCIYVLLDTFRQVQVAKATTSYEEEHS